MPILNYTTTIAASKTIGEIQAILSHRGVTRIATIYDEKGEASALMFTMKADYGFRDFMLPVKADGVLAAMTRDKSIARSKCTREQAARVGWRIAKEWLEVQAALIDAELATLDEVMLPYMLSGNGETLYETYRGQQLALESKKED